MKKKLIGLAVLLVLLGMIGIAQATLTVIGTAQFGGTGPEYNLIWDDDNNGESVIWLDYSHAQTQSQPPQNDWAAGLNGQLGIVWNPGISVTWEDSAGVSSVWRLPYAGENPIVGYNQITSEMGHLYYEELGLTGGVSITSDQLNASNFDNLIAWWYWSGTKYAGPGGYWYFAFHFGAQSNGIGMYPGGYGLALRNGQVVMLSTVTTQAVTGTSTTTATGNGNITNLGSPNPTAHGVCWSTSTGPTVSDNYTDEGEALTTGAFSSNMTGLTAHETYYVRAYATNSAGTSYGEQVSFILGITVSDLSSVTTDEDGAVATFTVKLDFQPTSDVSISLGSSDVSEGTVVPANLIFTPTNWNTAQTVTVTGANDDLLDGNIAYTVEINPAVSDDSGYNGNDPADKDLTNIDTDIDDDNDGISNEKEGAGDSDGDSTPDAQDTDSDNDGIPDLKEGSDDRDSDGVMNFQDFDPTGYFYDSATGEILSSGSISVSGPIGSTVTFVSGLNGADGYYQFVVDQPGIYTITVTPPAEYTVDSSGCAASGTLTANGTPNPLVLGSSENGTTGYMADYSCGANEWYLTIDIQDTTPLILNNNIPLVSSESMPTLNEWGMIISSCLLALAALTVLRRREEM